MSDTNKTMLVVGGGIMGAGIATSFASAGWTVHVMSPSKKTRDALPANIRTGLTKLQVDEALAAKVGIHETLDSVPWAALDLVVESVTEDLALKQRLFPDLAARSTPTTILATNTSSFPIGAIAEGLSPADRARVAGLHYFMPAHLVPLVEIVRSEWTSEAIADKLEAWMRAARKAPIRVNKDITGFIGNRLQAALIREALYLVESGATTAQGIDDAVRFGFGFRFLACGPMKQKEFSGWDTNLAAGNVIYPTLCNGEKHGEMLHKMIAEGRIGMKTKRGFWEYTDESMASEKAAYEKKLRSAFELLQSELG
jgi:3-hydroxybutyryl-CoA dehydrogenase